jgi:hypothetical protein
LTKKYLLIVSMLLLLVGPTNALEIYVSSSNYDLIVAEGQQGLFRCYVGLGSREFPTPVGEYFITYLFDDDPWWIPPKNRPWAYGKSASKRVYGGTMAPLLKKKVARTSFDGEDCIAMECTLIDNDYRVHGTQEKFSIGRNQSHGCVRMLPKDAKQVADLIKQYAGVCNQGETVNGKFVVLCKPVRLNIVK